MASSTVLIPPLLELPLGACSSFLVLGDKNPQNFVARNSIDLPPGGLSAGPSWVCSPRFQPVGLWAGPLVWLQEQARLCSCASQGACCTRWGLGLPHTMLA